MSRTRDLLAAIAAVVAGAVIAVVADRGGWSPEALSGVGLAAMVIIGALAWHVDWSSVGRRRRS